MEPGFNPTGWIDDLRECVCCGVDAEYLHQTGKPPLKPIPREKRRGVWLDCPPGAYAPNDKGEEMGWSAPKGLHCEMCIELWRDALVENLD